MLDGVISGHKVLVAILKNLTKTSMPHLIFLKNNLDTLSNGQTSEVKMNGKSFPTGVEAGASGKNLGPVTGG